MARGPKKHLKRVAAPKSWMLDKMAGVYASRPSQGPHKLRESVPLSLVLQRKLKYALTGQETKVILKEKSNKVNVDGVTRRNFKYPVGLMDIISIPKTGDLLRVLYDVKGRFTFVPLKDQKEGDYKICKIVKKFLGPNKVPYAITHDARTLRFINPAIKINDSIKYNLKTGEITEHYKQAVGNVVLTTAGNNKGRVGIITNIIQKPGQIDVVSLKDVNGHVFSTRLANTFVIGTGKTPAITLPRDQGVKKELVDLVKKAKVESDDE